MTVVRDALSEDVLAVLATRQNSLLRITDAAAKADFGPEMFRAMAGTVRQVTGYDAATIALYDAEADGFRIMGFCNLPSDWVDEVTDNRMIIRMRPVQQALAHSARPLVFSNFDDHPFSRSPRSRSGSRGMAMVPFRLDSGSWGCLTVQSHVEIDWSQDEIVWLTLVARHCAMPIKCMKIVDEMKCRLLQEDETLRVELRGELMRVLDRSGVRSTGLAGRPPARAATGEPLTQREEEVLTWIASGATNQEIAAALYISVSTVKKHLHSILEKLHVENRIQAAVYATQPVSWSIPG